MKVVSTIALLALSCATAFTQQVSRDSKNGEELKAVVTDQNTADNAATPNYAFTEVNFAGDTFTQLLGINANNQVAGYHGSGASGHPNKGFVFTAPNTFTAENFPNSAQTQVIGINNVGDTAGFYVDTAGKTHGFFTRAGRFSGRDFPGTTFNQFLGLNNHSQSAGYWQDNAGNFHPYVYSQSNYYDSQLLVGSNSAQATGSNDAGSVVGFYIDAAGVNHGFLLTQGNFVRITYPNATFTQALGVNNSNTVVGTYTDAQNNTHGFIRAANGTLTSLDDPNGIGTTIINGINDAGTVVGFWGNLGAGVSHGFIAKPM